LAGSLGTSNVQSNPPVELVVIVGGTTTVPSEQGFGVTKTLAKETVTPPPIVNPVPVTVNALWKTPCEGVTTMVGDVTVNTEGAVGVTVVWSQATTG
jgi:hypothetical protein